MNYKDRIKKIKQDFIKNITNHKVEILNDNGVNRTLRCSNNGSCYYKFYITTWDGYLCVSGDMGVWVFSRLQDMFEFFRGHENPDFHYWAEKLEGGIDRCHSIAEHWNGDLFIEQVKNHINNYIEDEEEQSKYLALCEENLFSHTSFESEAMQAIYDCDEINDGLFGSLYEHGFGKEYHPRFIWICFAIVWAIKEYDKIKNGE